MAAFSELIKNFDKIRDYMRDFYIYGFKSRNDFDKKSARSYDNEKRRIESYLVKHIKWAYDKKGKRTFVSLNSANISRNPLYSAWKSKSFTDSDIMLHFAILDLLSCGEAKNVSRLTDEACLLLDRTFDVQTVRGKCREYEKEGILLAEKNGNTILYRLANDTFPGELSDAVSFFSEAAPFGEIGSFIIDDTGIENDVFRFKHHFIVHTLEDGILLDILNAMKNKCWIEITNFSEKNKNETTVRGVPLKILSSVVTGRRYVVLHQPHNRKFATYRLDYIKSIKQQPIYDDFEKAGEQLQEILPFIWGVSFGSSRKGSLRMKLHIDENEEAYVLERLNREGRGGEISKLEDDTFLYSKDLCDPGEIATWIKTFIGRIISLEGSDSKIVDRFNQDIERMKNMYSKQGLI